MNNLATQYPTTPKALVEEIYVPPISKQAHTKQKPEDKPSKQQANKSFARSLEASCDCV